MPRGVKGSMILATKTSIHDLNNQTRQRVSFVSVFVSTSVSAVIFAVCGPLCSLLSAGPGGGFPRGRHDGPQAAL